MFTMILGLNIYCLLILLFSNIFEDCLLYYIYYVYIVSCCLEESLAAVWPSGWPGPVRRAVISWLSGNNSWEGDHLAVRQ
jgi:hypothetical protein